VEQNDKNRTIALAATLQACGLVRKLAYNDSADEGETRTMLESLFMNEASSIQQIYGDLSSLKTGRW
jgi:CII-binding regulator of phage lambda lysogenization HflD